MGWTLTENCDSIEESIEKNPKTIIPMFVSNPLKRYLGFTTERGKRERKGETDRV